MNEARNLCVVIGMFAMFCLGVLLLIGLIGHISEYRDRKAGKPWNLTFILMLLAMPMIGCVSKRELRTQTDLAFQSGRRDAQAEFVRDRLNWTDIMYRKKREGKDHK